MIIDNLKSLIEIYVMYSEKKQAEREQKMFDITLLNLFKLGGDGTHGICESQLQFIQGISRMDLFFATKKGEMMELIHDCSTHSGRQLMLTQDGILYVKALLADMN